MVATGKRNCTSEIFLVPSNWRNSKWSTLYHQKLQLNEGNENVRRATRHPSRTLDVKDRVVHLMTLVDVKPLSNFGWA